MRLSKVQSRQRWAEVRSLWSEWDPIGVTSMTDWPRDEYDSYLGPTLRLLESNAPVERIVDYLTEVELGHMGLSETERSKTRRAEFAARLREWYEKHWAGSRV